MAEAAQATVRGEIGVNLTLRESPRGVTLGADRLSSLRVAVEERAAQGIAPAATDESAHCPRGIYDGHVTRAGAKATTLLIPETLDGKASLERARGLVLRGATVDVPHLPLGLLPRPQLLARLRDARDARVVTVVAPPGYGKTTLLTQWANEDGRPFAWVSVSRADNDGMELLTYLALALNGPTPLDEDPVAGLSMSAEERSSVLLSRVREVLEGLSGPFVLVIDDVHLLRREGAVSVLKALADNVSPGSQLVLAGRDDPPLSLARIDASRRLLRIGTESLKMSSLEGMALLRAEGVELTPAVGDALVNQAEGWPAGLYFAALALREQPDAEQAAKRFAGDDALIADYLCEEVLRSLTDDQRDFLMATSVLDRICGSLCDAVLEDPSAADTLDELARTNRFVMPLDRRGEWYRYHHLFQDMLRSQLHRREPERESLLHGRASGWLEARGDVSGAIDHAIAAGDTSRVAALAWCYAPRYLRHGRTATVGEWLEPFTPDEIAEYPALALSKAWWCLTASDTRAVDHWTAVAERGGAADLLPDGTPLRSAILLLHAVVGNEGVTRVRDDAAMAFELDRAGGSSWRPIARLLEGSALRLLGEPELARAALSEGARLASVFVPGTQAQCLCQLALLAIDEGEWSEADALAARAIGLVEEYSLGEQPGMAQIYALLALLLARRGAMIEARAQSKHARWLLELLVNVGPWFVAETMLLLARTSHLQGDVATARMLVRDAELMLSRYPDAGFLPAKALEVKGMTSASALRAGLNAAPLTPAEIRVLRYLPTHMSFGAIAKELFVSRSTVKTQAIAVYRKLGVSSRAQAVEQARQLGLLGE